MTLPSSYFGVREGATKMTLASGRAAELTAGREHVLWPLGVCGAG